jgi:uncharacterized protein with HEPN domain
MTLAAWYLHDIGRLAKKLSREFGVLPYEKFVRDAKKIESAAMKLMIMKEGWIWLPSKIRQQLVPIDWRSVIGKWDRDAGRRVGIDPRKLWDTIAQKLPEMNRKIEALLES